MEVPDVAAEVEVSSKRRKTAPKDAANKRSLRRKEKIAVADTISKADINELAAFVLQQVDVKKESDNFNSSHVSLLCGKKFKCCSLFVSVLGLCIIAYSRANTPEMPIVSLIVDKFELAPSHTSRLVLKPYKW